MEICCDQLDGNRLAVEIGEVVRWIHQRVDGEISVMYGFGCTNDDKNQWEWIRVPAAGLSEFLAISARRGIFEQGRADFFVRIPDLSVDVTLCHESDIHIKGDVGDYLDHFRVRWLRQGIRVWSRTDGNTEWKEAQLPDSA